MSKVTPLNKSTLRKIYKEKRRNISEERRYEARVTVFETLYPILSSYRTVLSFSNHPEEIDMRHLNEMLAKEGRLLLPHTQGKTLVPYVVENLQTDLMASAYGILEPNEKRCVKADPESIEVILVPAVAFDRTQHRLGYGLGCYDRFLSTYPHWTTIGVGFKEQLMDETLPIEHHDIPMKKLYLF